MSDEQIIEENIEHNIGSFVLTNTDYALLSETINKTFDSDKIYIIQNLGGDIFVRCGTEGKGNLIEFKKIFYYDTKENDDLYIAPAVSSMHRTNEINISFRFKGDDEKCIFHPQQP